MFVHNFRSDYEAIEKALKEGKPFALSRFGDGEWSILKKRPYKAASGWTTKGDTWLSGALLESLSADLPGYCVGYSPPCCHPKCVGFYADNMRVPKQRRTYATVFFHGNFQRAKAFFSRLPAALVGCTKGGDIKVSRYATNAPVDVDEIVQQMLEVKDRPILLAAGPLACVLVHRYWRWTKRHPEDRVACVDIGGLMDEALHGKKTRYYHDPKSGLHQHFCDFGDWSAARQREVIAVHNSVRGRFDRFKQAPNQMKAPLEQVAERRGSTSQPSWLSRRPKTKVKGRRK